MTELIEQALGKLNEARRLLELLVLKPATDEDEPDLAFLDCRIDTIDFGKGYTARVRNICQNHEEWVSSGKYNRHRPIVTVRDLLAVTHAQLLRNPNMGRKTVKAIQDVLAAHGLRLGMFAS